MTEINSEVINNASEIYAGLPTTLDEEPYMPSNGAEGDIFIGRWCETCIHDVGKNCKILDMTFCGEQPKEWVYFENKPICKAYKKREENGL